MLSFLRDTGRLLIRYLLVGAVFGFAGIIIAAFNYAGYDGMWPRICLLVVGFVLAHFIWKWSADLFLSSFQACQIGSSGNSIILLAERDLNSWAYGSIEISQSQSQWRLVQFQQPRIEDLRICLIAPNQLTTNTTSSNINTTKTILVAAA
jgi:hypothetical protein